MPAHLTKAKGAAEVLSADLLFKRLEELRCDTIAVMSVAKKARDSRTILAAIGRLESQLRLLTELAGQLRCGEGSSDPIEWPTDLSKLSEKQTTKLVVWLEQFAAARDPEWYAKFKKAKALGLPAPGSAPEQAAG